MNKLLCLIFLLPLLAFAQDSEPVIEQAPGLTNASSSHDDHGTPALTTETTTADYTYINPRQSHWVTSFGFEGIEYELPWEYTGAKDRFREEKRKLYGGRLGFGREFHLGKGFMTATKVESFYMGTLFESAQTADPKVKIEFASTKDAGHIFGLEAVQSISYIFDMKTKNPFMDEWTYLYVEPFIEAGFGRARAYNAKKYSYDTFDASSPSTTYREEYSHRFEDDITNARIGAGVNFTSTTGYFLYLKATQNRYDVSERKSRGYQYPNGGSRTSLKGNIDNVDMDPVMVYAIGGGYKF